MLEEGSSIHSPLILIAEHNEGERNGMREVLIAAGYMVVAVGSLEATEALFKNGAVSSLLIISAGLLDGNEAWLDKLLTLARPSPRVIVYGIDPGGRVAIYCLNRGACEFLLKPFARDELLNAVEHALGHGQPAASTDDDTLVASRPVTGWIELNAASKLEQLRRIQRFYDVLFDSSLPSDVCEDLKMAVEEVGRNAMEWGNNFDPSKQVHLSYCRFDDRIVIKVEDEGEGFKPESVPDPTADPAAAMKLRVAAGKRPGGYGVYLIQKLVDEVVYNEKGNTVLMIKYLPPQESEAVESVGGK